MAPTSAGSGKGVPAFRKMAAKLPRSDSSATPFFAVEGKDCISTSMEDATWRRSARWPCASLMSSSTEGKEPRAPTAPCSMVNVSPPS
ncbi:unnamed protein product [Lampetra fluviatilis]